MGTCTTFDSSHTPLKLNQSTKPHFPSANCAICIAIFLFILQKAELRITWSDEARALDSLLQEYAVRAFPGPRTKTGIAYNGFAPSNLTGIEVSAMRLRSGSLRSRGVRMYREFEIPIGVLEQPYVERLVLVYHNFRNWSVTYYPPPPGYTYLAPVLGLLAYNASELAMAQRNFLLPELLRIRASHQPISINFSAAAVGSNRMAKKCVLFDVNGSVKLSDVSSGNICKTFQQGHFSIVVEENSSNSNSKKSSSSRRKVWRRIIIIVGSIVGGFALPVVLGLVIVWIRKHRHRKLMDYMEKAADIGEALHMTSVGNAKAPAAAGTRTQPTLETEYVP
ncbi:hypothetical protein STAS_14385 [Striga asiatica]|uniref:Uncharacterized protein n=1 Tax=Striga asiatica TaxID=4170 RepID=A0A5A7Q0M2_STRAF|nr:hypothetical protein STAS_14385 [Striga asiatica]